MLSKMTQIKWGLLALLFFALSFIEPREAYSNNSYAPAYGAPTASDTISGILYPKFKMTYGDDGEDIPVSSTNPLPISGSISVSPGINSAGVISNNSSVTTGAAVTFIKPANAVGFIIENESVTPNAIRWAVGSTASASVGNYYESGRDSGYVPLAANISVIGIGGTASVSVQWILSN